MVMLWIFRLLVHLLQIYVLIYLCNAGHSKLITGNPPSLICYCTCM